MIKVAQNKWNRKKNPNLHLRFWIYLGPFNLLLRFPWSKPRTHFHDATSSPQQPLPNAVGHLRHRSFPWSLKVSILTPKTLSCLVIQFTLWQTNIASWNIPIVHRKSIFNPGSNFPASYVRLHGLYLDDWHLDPDTQWHPPVGNGPALLENLLSSASAPGNLKPSPVRGSCSNPSATHLSGPLWRLRSILQTIREPQRWMAEEGVEVMSRWCQGDGTL